VQHLIEAEGGDWVGSGISVGENRFRDGDPPMRSSWSSAELQGTGEYEGLTLFMNVTLDPDRGEVWRGMILPTDQVPAMPDPVAAE
jgi:hypothetical protein